MKTTSLKLNQPIINNHESMILQRDRVLLSRFPLKSDLGIISLIID
jgi:hypothetical protein